MVTPDGTPPSCPQFHDSLRVTLDSLKKWLSSAYCLPGTGIDLGYTKAKAKSPSLKSSNGLVKNSFLNFRELFHCLDCSLKMPVSGFYPRDDNSKGKRWSLEICLLVSINLVGETETQTRTVIIKQCAEVWWRHVGAITGGQGGVRSIQGGEQTKLWSGFHTEQADRTSSNCLGMGVAPNWGARVTQTRGDEELN